MSYSDASSNRHEPTQQEQDAFYAWVFSQADKSNQPQPQQEEKQ